MTIRDRVALLVPLLATSCLLAPGYACSSNENCRRDGEQGACVEDRCVFGDDGSGGDLDTDTTAADPTSGSDTGPAATTCVIDIAAGADHTCIVNDDGEILCWGSNEFHPIVADSETSYVAAPTVIEGFEGPFARVVAAKNTCATTLDGALWCRGHNENGQLDSQQGSRVNAIRVFPEADVDVVSTSVGGICVLDGGLLRCEGDVPDLPGLEGVASVSLSDKQACAILDDGSVQCWEEDGIPQSDVPPLVNASVVVAMANASCALADGTVACWGSSDNGLPDTQGLPGDIAQLSGRSRHACAVTTGGDLWCWGDNRGAQADPSGNDSGDTKLLPRSIGPSLASAVGAAPGDARFGRVAAGGQHTCAVTESGEVWCWGNAQCGRLGIELECEDDPDDPPAPDATRVSVCAE